MTNTTQAHICANEEVQCQHDEGDHDFATEASPYSPCTKRGCLCMDLVIDIRSDADRFASKVDGATEQHAYGKRLVSAGRILNTNERKRLGL